MYKLITVLHILQPSDKSVRTLQQNAYTPNNVIFNMHKFYLKRSTYLAHIRNTICIIS